MAREREDIITKYKTDNADLVYKVQNNTATEGDVAKFRSNIEKMKAKLFQWKTTDADYARNMK